ncbi:MAG: cupin [Gammaproteobacteria bacterium HGW-Gammaproteobacteria-4]|jgi:1,2-dihydroxy-3-keto-5-methylthiopentene dioxygenase|nr:MAG: cupin [Gammaproteobacteria bacterium HGW-Gammaproteobacteria-4]
MSRLRIFEETQPAHPILGTNAHAEISDTLALLGVRFERWKANAVLPPDASQDTVIAAYRSDIERLKAQGGYQAVDVISLNPDHPEREALRRKFLNEHTHGEDEVRFFVAGSGLFTLHVDQRVYEVLCHTGDLISVPANTPHWFDMGPQPYFVAIRLFTNPAGWVANFTGNAIAERFPRYEANAA